MDIAQILEGFGLKFVSSIARGAYGTVYKVHSDAYKEDFAIKRIPASKFNENEIQCMIEIKSSNIVPLYKYYKHDDCVYLLMEFCPNSLDKLVFERQPITIEKMYKLMFGMALSLKSCHDYGVFHGDVKPSNFLIDKYGRVKICDFGLSKLVKEDESSTEFVGTLVYEAPEILKKEPYEGFAPDIWSLGVTMFITITGQFPWCLNSKAELLKSMETASYNKDLIKDETFRNIVNMCLQVDPKKRPKISEIVALLRSKIEIGKPRLIRPISSALFGIPIAKSHSHARIRQVSSF